MRLNKDFVKTKKTGILSGKWILVRLALGWEKKTTEWRKNEQELCVWHTIINVRCQSSSPTGLDLKITRQSFMNKHVKHSFWLLLFSTFLIQM